MVISRDFFVRVRGDYACFTSEVKVERVSYDVPTPSAVRGMLRNILWKPAIEWYVREIYVMKKIRKICFYKNELEETKMANIEDAHIQRQTLALKDVDYIFRVYFRLTEQAGERDCRIKFTDMFLTRMERGSHFAFPYLGMREFGLTHLSLVEEPLPKAIALTRHLGKMPLYVYYDGSQNTIYFDAKIKSGVISVPEIL